MHAKCRSLFGAYKNSTYSANNVLASSRWGEHYIHVLQSTEKMVVVGGEGAIASQLLTLFQ